MSAALVAIAASAAATLLLGADSLSVLERVLLVAVGTAACLMLLREERRGRGPSIACVAVAIAAVTVVAVSIPPIGSHDLWSYVLYGRTVVVHHASPYTHPPADYPGDPLLAFVARGWRNTPSVYGPVFVAESAAGALVSGDSPLLARLFHQLVAAGALGAMLVVIWRRTRSPAALALVALHPALAVIVLNGGHNDLLLGLLILTGVLAGVDGRPRRAGVVLGLAILVKVTAGLALLGLVLWQLRRRTGRPALETGASAALVATAGYLVAGPGALRALAGSSGVISRASVWQTLRSVALRLGGTGGLGALTTLATIGVVALGGFLAWRVAARGSGVDSALASTAAYNVGAAYTLPWYAAWSLPLAALRPHSRVTTVVALHAGFLAAAYQLPQGLPPVAGLPDARLFVGCLLPLTLLALFVSHALLTSTPAPCEAMVASTDASTPETATSR